MYREGKEECRDVLGGGKDTLRQCSDAPGKGNGRRCSEGIQGCSGVTQGCYQVEKGMCGYSVLPWRNEGMFWASTKMLPG